MILAVDVQYQKNIAFVAGVLFTGWSSEKPIGKYVSVVNNIKDYEPGNFYKRELPCIRKLLEEHYLNPSTIVIDGYVYLDGKEKPGLGKRLYDSFSNNVEVIGVAKTMFSGIPKECELYRGESKKPLYITSIGNLEIAKENIAKMYGMYRVPDLLKQADRLCRETANKSFKPTPKSGAV